MPKEWAITPAGKDAVDDETVECFPKSGDSDRRWIRKTKKGTTSTTTTITLEPRVPDAPPLFRFQTTYSELDFERAAGPLPTITVWAVNFGKLYSITYGDFSSTSGIRLQNCPETPIVIQRVQTSLTVNQIHQIGYPPLNTLERSVSLLSVDSQLQDQLNMAPGCFSIPPGLFAVPEHTTSYPRRL